MIAIIMFFGIVLLLLFAQTIEEKNGRRVIEGPPDDMDWESIDQSGR